MFAGLVLIALVAASAGGVSAPRPRHDPWEAQNRARAKQGLLPRKVPSEKRKAKYARYAPVILPTSLPPAGAGGGPSVIPAPLAAVPAPAAAAPAPIVGPAPVVAAPVPVAPPARSVPRVATAPTPAARLELPYPPPPPPQRVAEEPAAATAAPSREPAVALSYPPPEPPSRWGAPPADAPDTGSDDWADPPGARLAARTAPAPDPVMVEGEGAEDIARFPIVSQRRLPEGDVVQVVRDGAGTLYEVTRDGGGHVLAAKALVVRWVVPPGR